MRTALVTLALLLAACTSNAPPPGATPTAEARPTVEATATPRIAVTPPVAPTEPPQIPPPPPDHVAWVIELATGAVSTLVEDPEFLFAAVPESGDRIFTFTPAGRRDFAFDGSPLEVPGRRCEQTDVAAVVDGRAYDGVICGAISANDRWMVYDVPIPDAERPDWDQWVLDLASGETRLLQPGLRHCGGCDGVIGLEFSADGDRLWFSEFTGGRVFAADLPSHTVRLIADDPGANNIGRQPIWSPAGARMLYTDDGERVFLADFDRGTTDLVEALTWPATFSPDGSVLYSPRFGPHGDGSRTVVVDGESFEVLLDVAGEPSDDLLWFDRPPIATTVGGHLVLALERGAGCHHGTTIYTPVDLEGSCVADAFGAAVSPDGAFVAVAVRREQVDTFRLLYSHEIVVIDVTTGQQRTLAEGAISSGAPLIAWSATGTHLLVVWPHEFGI